MLNRIFGKKYKKILVLGAGGGNDILSALLIAGYLKEEKIKVDIANMASPGFYHLFNSKGERGVNQVTIHSKRFLCPSLRDRIEAPYIDAHVPYICKKFGINIENFYTFSIRFGSETLTKMVNHLIVNNSYDAVIAVDAGGDILADPIRDYFLLSPMLDFSTLNLLNSIKGADVYLLAFALGADGEITFSRLKEIHNKKFPHLVKGGCYFSKEDVQIKLFKKMFEEFKVIRRGNTIPIFLNTLEYFETREEQDKIVCVCNAKEALVYKHICKRSIGIYNFIKESKTQIYPPTIGKGYFIDYKKLISINPLAALPYENILERYVQAKKKLTWVTELDGRYLWSGLNFKDILQKGNSLVFLAFPPHWDHLRKTRLIAEGLGQLKCGRVDIAVMCKQDLSENIRNIYNIEESNCQSGLCLVSQRKFSNEREAIADKIRKYQEKAVTGGKD